MSGKHARGRNAATRSHRPTYRGRRGASAVGVGLAIPVIGLATPSLAVDGGTRDQLAQCESGGNWAINTGNGYKGGLQFAATTWAAHGGGEFAANANEATREQQIIVAERVLASQGWGAWPACSAKLGLSGKSGSASGSSGGTTWSGSTTTPPTADGTPGVSAEDEEDDNSRYGPAAVDDDDEDDDDGDDADDDEDDDD